MREIIDQVIFEFNAAVEDRAVGLVLAGVSLDRIHVRHFSNARTQIWVDGVPDSEFRLESDHSAIWVVGRSLR